MKTFDMIANVYFYGTGKCSFLVFLVLRLCGYLFSIFFALHADGVGGYTGILECCFNSFPAFCRLQRVFNVSNRLARVGSV